MSDSVEIQTAKKEYKLRSATGTYIAALGKGRISNYNGRRKNDHSDKTREKKHNSGALL